jgi:hypothetical protein
VSLAILALALAAAAAGDDLSCPPPAGKWRELRTAHFVLSTDLAPAAADDLAEQLEVLRGADLAALGELAQSVEGPPLRVVAFARVEAFRDFVPAPLEGLFTPRGGGVVLLRGDRGRVTQASIVAHELMHGLLSRAIPVHPAWLAEGLAQYVEGAGEGRDGETLRLGAATAERAAGARTDRAPVGQVLEAPALFDGPRYATSWLLVHFLRAKHPERLVAYARRLARGETHAAAWSAIFPEWDPGTPGAADALDRSLTRYVRDDGEYVEARMKGRGEGASSVVELTAEDVRALCRALPRLAATPSSRPPP